MDKSFLELSELLQWVIVIGVFLTAWVLMYQACHFLKSRNVEFGKAKFSKINSTDFLAQEEAFDFSDNPVFGTIDKLIQIDLYSVDLDDKFRDLLMKSMVKIAWSAYRDSLTRFLTDANDARDHFQLKKKMIYCVTSSLSEAKKSFLAEGVPDIIIEKYLKSTNLFNVILLDFIDKTVTANRTKVDSMDLFFKFVSSTAVVTHHQFEFLFSSINGHLKGIIFKGVLCES